MRHNWIEIRANGPSAKKDEAALILVEAGCPGVLEEEAPASLGKLIPHSLGIEVSDGVGGAEHRAQPGRCKGGRKLENCTGSTPRPPLSSSDAAG